MSIFIQIVSFAGLGVLLGYMEYHAASSWEFWAVMGLAVLAGVGSFMQGAR